MMSVCVVSPEGFSRVFVACALSMLVSGCGAFSKKSSAESAAPAPVVVQESIGADLRDLPNVETDLDKATEAQLPRDVNDAVVRWIDYFEGRGRQHMERYLSRSTRYIPMMKETLRKEGLPDDLVYLALIESGFNSQARSHAGAVGYWQFIRDTGRLYDLEINRMVDQRKDPVLSSQAAARYLKGLYNMFGSWYLAIAAYNVGENKVKRMVMRNQTRDFWELARRKTLPRETIDYVPKFIAAKLIAKDPIKYGFTTVDYAMPFKYAEITSTQPVDLKKLSELINVSYEDIQLLNPAYRTQYAPMPKSSSALALRVPVDSQAKAKEVLPEAIVNLDESVNGHDAVRYVRIKVKRGETIEDFARRYETSMGSIRKANRLGRRVTRVRAGTTLRVPVGSMPLVLSTREDGTVVGEMPQFESVEIARGPRSRTKRARSSAAASPAKKGVHVVRRGDTLSSIARRYSLSLQDLTEANELRNSSQLSIGKKLVIPD
jgi:membrane-bound lytic murein transglycosylase D